MKPWGLAQKGPCVRTAYCVPRRSICRHIHVDAHTYTYTFACMCTYRYGMYTHHTYRHKRACVFIHVMLCAPTAINGRGVLQAGKAPGVQAEHCHHQLLRHFRGEGASTQLALTALGPASRERLPFLQKTIANITLPRLHSRSWRWCRCWPFVT